MMRRRRIGEADVLVDSAGVAVGKRRTRYEAGLCSQCGYSRVEYRQPREPAVAFSSAAARRTKVMLRPRVENFTDRCPGIIASPSDVMIVLAVCAGSVACHASLARAH